jgi:RimJ/RimL family protein N-acetyltransferase
MILRPFKPEDAIEILGYPKQPGLELTDQTRLWAEIKAVRGPAVTGIVDGKIIGCSGIEIMWTGVGEIWGLFVSDISDYTMEFVRESKHLVDEWQKEYNLVRIQAPMREDFKEGIRFIKWFGFKKEFTMRKYHPDGTNAIMYSKVGE